MTQILSLAQNIADELLIHRPSGLVAETDNHEAQAILRHLTRTCRQLAAEYDWEKITREHTFTTVEQDEQTGAIPADFLRMIQDTAFNRTTREKVGGPITKEDWQRRKASLTVNVYDEFIMRGGKLYITPTPPVGELIAYEYITKFIGIGPDGTTERTSFLDDGDTAYFDDELLILGTVWRYRKAEGTDYAEEKLEFELRKADMIKMDGGRRILRMDGGSSVERYPYPPKTPETLVFE